MNKRKIEKALRIELLDINRQIDEKIIKGISYASESRRHKFIISTLSRMRSREESWLSRSFGFSII
ncbi:MAG: hypothetical protein WAX44_04270 [Minisyncoccia bacterium]